MTPAGRAIVILAVTTVVAVAEAGVANRLDALGPRHRNDPRRECRSRGRHRSGRERWGRSRDPSSVAIRNGVPRDHRAAGRPDGPVLGRLQRPTRRRSASGLLPAARPWHVWPRARCRGALGGDPRPPDRQPSNQTIESWPDGEFDGRCEEVKVSLGPGPDSGAVPVETLCARTAGSTTAGRDEWSQRVTWTCVGCLIADHKDRAIALHEWLAVPAGTVPSWEIFADLGS